VIKHSPENGPFLKGLIPCLHFSENFKKFENLGGVKLKHLPEIQNMTGILYLESQVPKNVKVPNLKTKTVKHKPRALHPEPRILSHDPLTPRRKL
jgi:hypothetical protein